MRVDVGKPRTQLPLEPLRDLPTLPTIGNSDLNQPQGIVVGNINLTLMPPGDYSEAQTTAQFHPNKVSSRRFFELYPSIVVGR